MNRSRVKCFYCGGRPTHLVVGRWSEDPVCAAHIDKAEVSLLRTGMKVEEVRKFNPDYYNNWRI